MEIELVDAQGRLVRTNQNGTWINDSGIESFSENNDLFWACRGGGGTSWGIITHITVKIYKYRNECKKNCIYKQNDVYGGI